jgi:hypothetical protein
MTIPADRWPVEPLMAALGITYPAHLAEACGMSGTTLRKVLEHGLSDLQADRYALRNGLHPAIVWGPRWDDWALEHLPIADDDTYEDLVA